MIPQLCLMVAWPVGPTIFHLLHDFLTVHKWLRSGWRLGLRQWAADGYPQSEGQRRANELTPLSWHRILSAWACTVLPAVMLARAAAAGVCIYR